MERNTAPTFQRKTRSVAHPAALFAEGRDTSDLNQTASSGASAVPDSRQIFTRRIHNSDPESPQSASPSDLKVVQSVRGN